MEGQAEGARRNEQIAMLNEQIAMLNKSFSYSQIQGATKVSRPTVKRMPSGSKKLL